MKYQIFYCSFVILTFCALNLIECRDPFHNDTIFLKDCSQVGMSNATMCRKYMWEIGDDVRYYMRGYAVCGRDCIERLGTWKTKMWYCRWDNKDGCNGSPNKQISIITILFLTSLISWHRISSIA